MALIPHTYLPRSMFDMDMWMHPLGVGPSTLDLFDPFDELDRLMGRNLMWLSKPDGFLNDLVPSGPRVPNKYRVTLDIAGFNPKSIKTEIANGKLVVTGNEGSRHDSEDFSVKEFRRTYALPPHAEADKLASFVTSSGVLVVEVPLKEQPRRAACDLMPRIVDAETGGKRVDMNLALPEGLDPAKVSVTCKDRDLIVKAEDNIETSDRRSSVYYYKRITLPDNTDFDSLKCSVENNCLSFTAPLLSDFKGNHRTIPIELKKGQEQIAHK